MSAEFAEMRDNYLKQLGEDHIAVFRAGDGPSGGPFCFHITRHPLSLSLHIQKWCWEPVYLVKAWRGESKDLQAVQYKLRAHHLRGNWYAPSPEVMDTIEADGGELPQVPRTGGRRLKPETALEIYRAAHTCSQPYQMIGQHYGVSATAVGKIARGEAHAELFERTPVDQWGEFYVWERGLSGAPRYKYRVGRNRGTK